MKPSSLPSPENSSVVRYELTSHLGLFESAEEVGASVKRNRECFIKQETLLSRNYNFGNDINVDNAISTDSGITADYDSHRTAQRAMIQMKKCLQIRKERRKEKKRKEESVRKTADDKAFIGPPTR